MVVADVSDVVGKTIPQQYGRHQAHFDLLIIELETAGFQRGRPSEPAPANFATMANFNRCSPSLGSGSGFRCLWAVILSWSCRKSAD